jgi:hypothetical protein
MRTGRSRRRDPRGRSTTDGVARAAPPAPAWRGRLTRPDAAGWRGRLDGPVGATGGAGAPAPWILAGGVGRTARGREAFS